MTHPIDTACPACARQPGQPCLWDWPTDVEFHADRIVAANIVDSIESKEPETTVEAFNAAVIDSGLV